MMKFLIDFNVDQVCPGQVKTRYHDDDIETQENDFDPPSAAKVVLYENRTTVACMPVAHRNSMKTGGKVECRPKNAL